MRDDIYDKNGNFIPDWASSPWIQPPHGYKPPVKPKQRSILNRILRHLCWFVIGSFIVIVLEDRKLYRAVRDAILVAGAKTAYDYAKQQKQV